MSTRYTGRKEKQNTANASLTPIEDNYAKTPPTQTAEAAASQEGEATKPMKQAEAATAAAQQGEAIEEKKDERKALIGKKKT